MAANTLTLEDISKEMRRIDICMMTTRDANGMLESRPMSNNRDVEYAGDSYFFTLDTNQFVQDLRKDPHVCLVYEAYRHLRLSHLYICVSGNAVLSQDKNEFKAHWAKSCDKWFKQGVDTSGLTLIKVSAQHIKYWDGFDHGEVYLNAGPMRRAS